MDITTILTVVASAISASTIANVIYDLLKQFIREKHSLRKISNLDVSLEDEGNHNNLIKISLKSDRGIEHETIVDLVNELKGKLNKTEAIIDFEIQKPSQNDDSLSGSKELSGKIRGHK